MTSVSQDSFSTASTESGPGRGVPWSQEAEQAVLGAMLLDGDAALRGAELLEDGHFYREPHRRLFRALRALVEQRMVVDYVTVRDELSRRGELDLIGGIDYLDELASAVPTAANLEDHARLLHDKTIQRRLIEAATQIITETYEQRSSSRELLDSAEGKIFRIAESRHDQGFTRIKEMLWPAMERIESMQGRDSSITGVPSGFKPLDDMTAGFQRAELVIVAARPSMGKTAFCLNIATNAAHGGFGVAVFSLEMSKEALVQRMLCAEAQVDSQSLRQGRLREGDYPKLGKAAGILQTCPIWLDDTPALTLLEMRSKARRLRADNDVQLIIVDYLQLMRSPEYSDNRVQEISDISRSLKGLARELDVPVIALSQLSRASEQRGGDRHPLLSDLRDSGAIEQDADQVVFIHRPEMYRDQREKAEQKGESIDGLAEISLAKNRNGPTGVVRLHFHKQFTRFDDRTDREP
ncbi:MAG TPA: replicative DNA helicase [Gemmatimonadales bacterium]|nr:replicative DNA helicase [Gemmatimonadales bacterium]